MTYKDGTALEGVLQFAKEYAEKGSLLAEQIAQLEKCFEFELRQIRKK